MQKLDKRQELFTITMEECGELIQCCSKAMRRWELFKNSDSEVDLKEEIGDVYTMISLLVENDIVTWDEIKHREKIKRKNKYSPTLFCKVIKKTKQKTLDGQYVTPVKHNTIKEAKEWLKSYEDQPHLIFGNTTFQ